MENKPIAKELVLSEKAERLRDMIIQCNNIAGKIEAMLFGGIDDIGPAHQGNEGPVNLSLDVILQDGINRIEHLANNLERTVMQI